MPSRRWSSTARPRTFEPPAASCSTRGHADRILLSQDVCHDSQLTAYEGNGYTYLAETFLPRLRATGVDEATIETLTVENPRRILSLAAPEA